MYLSFWLPNMSLRLENILLNVGPTFASRHKKMLLCRHKSFHRYRFCFTNAPTMFSVKGSLSGMLVIQSTSLYLPHWAHSAGMYGSVALWRKRSSRVEGHETGASGETISLLTPCASRRPRLHHRSAVGSRPQCLLSVYNQSNYSSVLATEAEREEQMHFILSGTSGARAGGGQKSQGFQNKMTESEVQIPSYSHSFGCLSGSCRTQFRTQIR